ncbi:MAG: hypothetical protein M1132_01690 [Chloroflexi bacterium]|nr:hypothetical protein [Chloroflexota bacterium]
MEIVRVRTNETAQKWLWRQIVQVAVLEGLENRRTNARVNLDLEQRETTLFARLAQPLTQQGHCPYYITGE